MPRTLLARTFLLLAILVLLTTAAWLSLFRYMDAEPRARETAQLAASAVNLIRASLFAAAPEKRLGLFAEFSSREGIRLLPAEPEDRIEAMPNARFFTLLQRELHLRLGDHTRIAASVDGVPGFWVSFRLDEADEEEYWLVLPRAEGGQQALCLLPRGTQEGTRITLSGRRFALRLGQAVRFDLVARSQGQAQAGQIAALEGEGWTELPPLATVLPAQGVTVPVLEWVTKAAVAVLFFVYGARLKPDQALAGLKHWRLHLTILGLTFVVFPVIGWGLQVLSPWLLSPSLYAGVLYLTLVPSTVQSSINFTSIAKGNVAGAARLRKGKKNGKVYKKFSKSSARRSGCGDRMIFLLCFSCLPAEKMLQ